MARARDPAYEQAKQLYLESNGEMKLIDIADAVGKSDSQIRKWKSTNKWDDELKGNVTNETKSNVTNKKPKRTQKSTVEKSGESDEIIIHFEENETTDKQKLFVSYYVKYWNATKAYQKAYGCAYNTARTEGARLLAKPNIREEIVKVRDALTQDALLDKRSLLQKWIDIAFADITDFIEFGNEQEVVRDFETGNVVLDANGNPKMRTYSFVHLKEDAEVDGTILTSVTLGKDGVGIKLADKMKALEYLSKHFNLLSESDREKYHLAKAKADAEFAQIRVNKENGTQEDEYEDDGFIEALKGKEVTWDE